jgi:hypothetical protein
VAADERRRTATNGAHPVRAFVRTGSDLQDRQRTVKPAVAGTRPARPRLGPRSVTRNSVTRSRGRRSGAVARADVPATQSSWESAQPPARIRAGARRDERFARASRVAHWPMPPLPRPPRAPHARATAPRPSMPSPGLGAADRSDVVGTRQLAGGSRRCFKLRGCGGGCPQLGA